MQRQNGPDPVVWIPLAPARSDKASLWLQYPESTGEYGTMGGRLTAIAIGRSRTERAGQSREAPIGAAASRPYLEAEGWALGVAALGCQPAALCLRAQRADCLAK
eukprot:scaffold76165_cov38-Tisochrysis_lutea.AAC.4